MGHLDTGFLFFGNTSIRVLAIDGQQISVPAPALDVPPMHLPPGPHKIFVRAFRDPIAAYACLSATLEAGKIYVVQTNRPEIDSTEIWLEDKATGAILSQKQKAAAMREPVLVGPLVQAMLAHPLPAC